MAGATSLAQLILKKWGDDAAGAAKELEEKVGFPNAAYDPEYTGSNIMGGLALPVAAGLLSAGQSEDADAGAVSKVVKKIADGWDEAAWLAENPRPHPDVKMKDHTPEQRSEYKKWEYEKSKAKAGPAPGREISEAEALWVENNPRPDGDPRTHPEVKTWMNKRSMVRNGQLDPSKSKPKLDPSKSKTERKYQSAEERRERRRRYASEYRKENRGYATAQNAKYRAAKLQRTPEYSENDAINEIYNQASLLSNATGTPYQVDHVIPLQGENVSGLHVPGNLMIVPDKLNTSKSNAFTPGDDPMRFNDVAQKNISEQNAKGLLEDGFADPRLLAGTAGTTAAILAAPMIKDSGMISAPRSETLFDLTMGARDVERRLEGSLASLLFPSGLVDYLETVNRREEDPNAMTRGMALLDVLPF
jgi:hypothetical protein